MSELVPDLWWSHDEKLDYLILHVGQLQLTEIARLRRSNKGTNYFLEIDLPNYDLESIELEDHTSKPLEVQRKRAETWVRSWFKLANSRSAE